jgi:hypothetical protein
METTIRMLRNLALAALLGSALSATQQTVSAASCQSWSGSYYTISLSYCGEYFYEGDALSDMYSKAYYYATAYQYGTGVGLYWYARVTPFDQPAYYDSGWQVW